MPDDIAKLSRLPNPSRMLLADESAEAYDALLAECTQDLRPVDALERRQVELILRCDLDIDRQLRMIAQYLNPLAEEANCGAEVVREWHRRSLMHPSALEKLEEEEVQIPATEPPTLPEGDSRLTPLIARRYAQQRELMAIHQREAASAERRRRQAIELLFKIQDRRVRSAVPEVEVVEGTSDSGEGAQRRQGAQSRPSRADILMHLERILGETPGAAELLEPNGTIAAAIHLAECEARLDRTHRHYAEAQGVHRDAVLDHLQDHLEDLMYFN